MVLVEALSFPEVAFRDSAADPVWRYLKTPILPIFAQTLL
jgi:hypothetical protein